jgi:hypothetical protein
VTEVATYPVRIWVDQDVRKMEQWQPRIEHLISRANEYLGPAFGVKLEGEIREWGRKSPATDLMPIIEELADSDAGADVAWVIGVVMPAPTPQTAHHKLGLSAVPGRHVVIRAIFDPGPTDALEHKELVVFLHEWAHSAGALHEGDATSIMSLSYDLRADSFPPTSVAMARIGVQIRAAERAGDRAKAAELWGQFADVIEKNKVKLMPEERDPLLEGARKLASGATGGSGLSAEDKAAFDGAVEGAQAGDRVAAAKTMDALLAKYPKDAALRSAAGSVYANAGAFTKAETISKDPSSRARLLGSRRFYGLPPEAAKYQVTPDLEPEYVAMFEAAHEALSKKQGKQLAERASAALRRFPGAPGLLALACAANFHLNRAAKAKTQCAEALAAWEETVLAHFFAGQIDKGPEGTKHLERVLQLDPSLESQVRPLLEQRKRK